MRRLSNQVDDLKEQLNQKQKLLDQNHHQEQQIEEDWGQEKQSLEDTISKLKKQLEELKVCFCDTCYNNHYACSTEEIFILLFGSSEELKILKIYILVTASSK